VNQTKARRQTLDSVRKELHTLVADQLDLLREKKVIGPDLSTSAIQVIEVRAQSGAQVRIELAAERTAPKPVATVPSNSSKATTQAQLKAIAKRVNELGYDDDSVDHEAAQVGAINWRTVRAHATALITHLDDIKARG